jgi:hypothetical protein
MPTALGSSGAARSTAAGADVRTLGIWPGGDPTANRLALQAAVDAGTPLFFPSGTYRFDLPIFGDKGVRWVGEDRVATTLAAVAGNQYPIVILGLPRAPQGVALSPDHFVDLATAGPGASPILDPTAWPGGNATPGVRWGLRTWVDDPAAGRRGAHLAQQWGPLAMPDAWRDPPQKLTVDIALDLSHAALAPAQSYSFLGIADGGTPQPWVAYLFSNGIRVDFLTADGVLRHVAMGHAGTTFQRLSFQIDLTTAEVLAFINRVQSAVDLSQVGPGWAPGLAFASNRNSPFQVAAAGGSVSAVAEVYGAPVDLTLCGLRVTLDAVYAGDGAGRPQRRLDGTPNDDGHQFFGRIVSVSGPQHWLPLADDPATFAPLRLVRQQSFINGSFCNYVLLFLDNTLHGVTGATTGGSIRDLTIDVGGGGGYAEAIAVGNAIGLELEQCSIYGGACGLGYWNAAGSFPVRIRSCEFRGSYSGLYMAVASSVFANDVQVTLGGRYGIHLYQTQAALRDVELPGFSDCEYNVYLQDSAGLLDNVQIDFESGQYPSKGAVFCSYSPRAAQEGCALTINGLHAGLMAPGAPLLTLDDGGVEEATSDFAFRCLLVLGEAAWDASGRGDMIQAGALWHGEVQSQQMLARGAYVRGTGPGGTTYVRSVHSEYTGLPRECGWTKGSPRLLLRGAGSGQAAELGCLTSGQAGTATPPRWYVARAIDLDDNALGCLAMAHAYWTAGGAASRVGTWCDYPIVSFLNWLFAGAPMPAAPATLYAGLAATTSLRNGQVTPLDYAPRPAVGADFWDAATSGARASARPLGFPTVAGNPGAALALFLADAAGSGRCLCQIDIDPLPLTAGLVPTFTAGTIRHAATATSRAMALRYWDLFADFWLRGVALPAPPTLYAALSTDHADVANPPAEPTGGSYARAAAPAAAWNPAVASRTYLSGYVTNARPIAFPAPTGPWGTVKSVYLMDAAAGGHVVWAADLAVPRAVAAGTPAPAFNPGAFWASMA